MQNQISFQQVQTQEIRVGREYARRKLRLDTDVDEVLNISVHGGLGLMHDANQNISGPYNYKKKNQEVKQNGKGHKRNTSVESSIKRGGNLLACHFQKLSSMVCAQLTEEFSIKL
jgi:hypothetical protein